MDEVKNSTGLHKKLRDDEVKQIMVQLFQAVEYLHRNNICHRDLKPDNIMVQKIDVNH